jgi:hypothetical protein
MWHRVIWQKVIIVSEEPVASIFIHSSTLQMDAVGSFKTMVTFYHNTPHHIPEDQNGILEYFKFILVRVFSLLLRSRTFVTSNEKLLIRFIILVTGENEARPEDGSNNFHPNAGNFLPV